MSRPTQTPKLIPTVFICYRRAETEAYAAQVRDALKSHFGGRARVFWDHDDITPGVVFPEVIRDAIATSASLVAIIGKQWLGIKDEETGRPRLESEKDFVRVEIASALKAGVRVIPVLVQDAQMPGESHLPEDLKPLATWSALELSFKRWDYDSRKLIEAVESSLPVPERRTAVEVFSYVLLAPLREASWLWRAAVAVVLAVLIFGTWKALPLLFKGAAGGDAAVNTLLPETGPGFIIFNRDPDGADQYGREETIRAVAEIAAAWSAKHPQIQLAVGDISRRGGGSFPPHSDHQDGRDVDFRPLTNNGRNEPTNIDASKYSHKLTRELVMLIKQKYPSAEITFNDPVLVSERLTKEDPGQDNHLHVRFPQ